MKKTHYICWWQKATTIIIIIIIIYIHYIFYFNFNSVHGKTHNWVLMGNNERRQSDSSTDVDQMLAGIERHCVFPARFHWFFSANGSSTKKKKSCSPPFTLSHMCTQAAWCFAQFASQCTTKVWNYWAVVSVKGFPEPDTTEAFSVGFFFNFFSRT